jgi:apoptotic chromatin condensation inducer in the nucleus
LQHEVQQEHDKNLALKVSELEEMEKMRSLRQEKARLEEEVTTKAETERQKREEKVKQQPEDEEREVQVAEEEDDDDDDAIVVDTTEIISDDDELSQEHKKSSPQKRKSDYAKSSSPEKKKKEGGHLKDINSDVHPFLKDAKEKLKDREIEKETGSDNLVKGNGENKVGELIETLDNIETAVKVIGNDNGHHESNGGHVIAVDKLPKPIIESKNVNKISEANPLNSSVISIRNLVRPFTETQLRECLKRTGKIVDQGFWINKIKSHAIVQVIQLRQFCPQIV